MQRVWSAAGHPSNRLIGWIQSELEMHPWKSANWRSFARLPRSSIHAYGEKVHTVQSNVTAQIKALEEELGRPLFDRLGRRVALTDAGRNFLPFAEQALAAMQQGQRSVQSGAEPSGPLRVGIPESMLAYRLPPVLRIFQRRFPHVELMFRPQNDEALPILLETGKLDMAVCMIDSSRIRLSNAFRCVQRGFFCWRILRIRWRRGGR